MNDLIFYFALFLALELFESNWQKSDSLYGVLTNNYRIYKKHMILYFFMNPTFFYSIYLSMVFNDFGFWMSSIVILKFLDIIFRLSILNKLDKKQDIKEILPFNPPMNIYFSYLNLFIYLPLLFFAFLNN